MAGRNVEFDMTYLTGTSMYRASITQADESPYADFGGQPIPALRLDINASKLQYEPRPSDAPPKCEVTARGYNAQLMLYVRFECSGAEGCACGVGLVDGVLEEDDASCHAVIRVWGWDVPLNGSVAGHWCLIHEQSVLCDTLIPIRNIPNTQYVVTVDFLPAGSEVSVFEQHTL